MTRVSKAIKPCAVLLVAAIFLSAQAQFFGGGHRRSFDFRDPELVREQDEMQNSLNPGFTEDVFTFARLKFDAQEGYGYGGGRIWDDDSPMADLSLTYRLHQVTSLKVRPNVNYIDITAKDLANYPFSTLR